MMETMITVERALELIKLHVTSLNEALLPIEKAEGLMLAQDIISSQDFPAFAQSNMDGYAFMLDENRTSYALVGEVAAGADRPLIIEKGQAVRIFTGAAIPEGADTVLAQEQSEVKQGQLINLNQNSKKGDHVRAVGTEIKKGQLALPKGTILKPAAIGFLAGIGVHQVLVYSRPTVGIIVTGNELQQPGLPLSYGQVYESNSYTLKTALQQLHIHDVKVVQVNDQLKDLSAALKEALYNSDIVLMTGGVSVGDYDFTLKAFKQNEVNTVFHKIKQKPGKPLLFGTKGQKILFGLPGNPASVLTCFYEYILPAIGNLMQRDLSLPSTKAVITHDYTKPAGLKHFLKAFYDGEKVSLHLGQESYKLSSYAIANCLAILPEACSELTAGTLIDIHLLP